MKLTLCIDKQDRYNPSDELRQYLLEIGNPLRSYKDVFDELTISTNNEKKLIGSITRRCYVDKFGVLKLLQSEEVQELTLPEIVLFEGTNYVYIKEFSNLNMKIEYLTNAEMNKYFATKMEMNSTIQQTKDSILMKVFQKTDVEEIIAAINMTPGKIKLLAKLLELEGYTTINGSFSIDEEGNVTLKNGLIALVDDSSDLKNSKFTISDPNNKRIYVKPNTLILQNGLSDSLGTNELELQLYEPGSEAYLRLQQVYESIEGEVPKRCGLDIRVSSDYQAFTLSGKNGSLFHVDNNFGTRVTNLIAEKIQLYNDKLLLSTGINRLSFIDSGPYLELQLDHSVNGSTSFGVNVWASDKRLKDNIKDSSYNALEKLKLIKHREFDYKNGGHVALGYVADELEKIDPDFIFEVGEDKLKQPSIDKLIPLLSKAIQEQQLQIENLKNELEVLKNAK